jgi:CheY-like chemotaxis protein
MKSVFLSAAIREFGYKKRDYLNLLRLSFECFATAQIVALADPTSAVEAARNETPDLILLDVQMTPISGKEVMHDIKATPELTDLPVAFFTGTDDPEEKKDWLP